eukprot:scaffold133429_cov21-Tisochrysis_lutea.AAC.2
MKRGVLATSHFVHWRCARNALKEKFISAASQLLSLTHVLNKGFLCRCDLPPSRVLLHTCFATLLAVLIDPAV